MLLFQDFEGEIWKIRFKSDREIVYVINLERIGTFQVIPLKMYRTHKYLGISCSQCHFSPPLTSEKEDSPKLLKNSLLNVSEITRDILVYI